MERVRRSAAATLLLLLAVTFAPLLCRVGGVPAEPVQTAAVAQAAVQAGDGTEAGPVAHQAVAQAPKKCSGQHAPSQNESVPVPTPNRGEPLAPAATAPAPLAAAAPACFALARPPTGTAPATDHTALLPVLRI
ncbi:hypothetical protein OEIGOIKO_02459 [Streptomyces chrestomyceticus JCM 4735]|uniref:Uncharacterized protein n=1 Tax=Streptomyces chrestomyceticus JCM 4735 TaxID=1306181 RepID=A0A7U9PXW4_9ACTN|nr:hypothetical protein [Streptomyces chrestomyceticus]GCD34720.1 hypothetical protein OEIGOIKO_02459 [Streptomyces chrestomyceticus JCM 4735]